MSEWLLVGLLTLMFAFNVQTMIRFNNVEKRLEKLGK